MPHLFNPTGLTLRGHYAGIQYVFPPKSRTSIKSRRMAEEVHVAEDIASKLYADLSQVGLILLDEENPMTDEEAVSVSRSNIVAFIQKMIDDFNDINSEQASGGGKILQVPKHYRELYGMLKELRAEEGEDAGEGFTSKERLEAMRARAEAIRLEQESAPQAGAATAEGQIGEEGFVTRSAPGRRPQAGHKPRGRRGRPRRAARGRA